MDTHFGYYNSLLKYTKTVPCPCEEQINLDLKRTFPNEPKCMEESFLKKMKNILICYSMRNSTVGYCQGMNFIVSRLLLIMDNEEQVFWLFVQIIENILSVLYYNELSGIFIDTTLIESFMSIYLPSLNKFLVNNDLIPTVVNFIHKWIVCIFTQTFQPKMVYTFLDFFFVDGSITLFKNSIFILANLQKEIRSQETFEDVYSLLINVENKLTNPKNMIYFLCQKKFAFKKNDITNYRKKLQIPIINKTINQVLLSNGRRSSIEKKAILDKRNVHCDPLWPFCLFGSSINEINDYFIIKEHRAPLIIDDYYYIKNTGEQEGISDEDDLLVNQEVLIERHKHKCDDQKIVDLCKIFDENDYEKSYEDTSNSNGKKSKEMKIYISFKKCKDIDIIIQGIKKDLKEKEKDNIIEENEINAINEKNKNNDYYPKNYKLYEIE